MATVKKGIECFKINGRPDLQKLFDNHPEKGKKSDFEIAREIILGEEKVLHDRLNTVKEKLKLPTKPYTQPEFPQQRIDEINKIAEDEKKRLAEANLVDEEKVVILGQTSKDANNIISDRLSPEEKSGAVAGGERNVEATNIVNRIHQSSEQGEGKQQKLSQESNKNDESVETKKEPPPKATVDEVGETATGETEVLDEGDEGGGEPPKPLSKKEAVEDGDDLTKRFKEWTVIDKDKTITQDVKDTHELREGAELLNEDYQRLQRDKAATDLSMDLLIQDARAQLGDKYLDFLLNLVENGNLELETRNAIMQSLLWRQGLSPDIINNLKAIDKKLATRSQDNFMIRRSLATEDEISDEQNDMIESAFGDEGAEIKKAKEVLNEFFSDNTVDEKVQMSAEGKTIEELNEEIADLQKQLQEAKETPKAGKVDSKKFKAKAEMAANNIKNKEGNGWFSKIIDEINEIAKKC